MNLIKVFIVSIVVLISSLASAQLGGVSYNWKEKRNKKGIMIATSSVADSRFKAVRGEMVVNASVSALVALVEDLGACKDWAAMCKEARVEKRVSPSESYAYIYYDIPFPVSDRDKYTHVVWTQDPKTKRVSMNSIATIGGTPKSKAVRIEKAVSQWHFTPQEDGTTIVESFGHIDPNGPTPAWITNLMLVDSPYKSMSRMRELVESGKYTDAEVPFLSGL